MKLNPKIYRRAAELVADGSTIGCCLAITCATVACHCYGEEAHQMEFEELFKPTEKEWHQLNHEACRYLKWPDFWWLGKQEKNERILALLFMEQITRNL